MAAYQVTMVSRFMRNHLASVDPFASHMLLRSEETWAKLSGPPEQEADTNSPTQWHLF